MSRRSIFFLTLFSLLVGGLLSGQAFAAMGPGIGGPSSPSPLNSGPKQVQKMPGQDDPKSLEELDPLKGASFYTVIKRVINTLLGMVGALALAVFVFSGVTWMTAGSSDRIKVAKDSMKYAVIGLALIGFSYAITTFFIDTLTGRIEQQVKQEEVEYATPPYPNP